MQNHKLVPFECETTLPVRCPALHVEFPPVGSVKELEKGKIRIDTPTRDGKIRVLIMEDDSCIGIYKR